MAQALKARRSYHHGDLEDALIQAAISIVRSNGPDHLSLREAAAKIGVSPSAAYHYFTDKDALQTAIGSRILDQLADAQESAIKRNPGHSAASARKRFRAMGHAYFMWALKEPNLYRLAFGGYCNFTSAREEGRAWKLLASGLDDLLEARVITRATREGGEIFVWSAVHGACSLIIEGILPKSAIEGVLSGIERALERA